MIQDVRAWLPRSAATSDVIRTGLEAAVADWRGRWFAKGDIRLADLAASERRPAQVGEETIQGDSVSLTLLAKSKARLLQLALDKRLEGLTLTEADRKVLDGFADRLWRSLIDLVEQSLELASPDPGGAIPYAKIPSEGIAATLSDGRDALLTLWTPLSSALPTIKASLPARRLHTAGLTHPGDAISANSVTLEASLGGAVVSLADLQSFEAGDVIVLDTPMSDGIALASGDTEIARGALSHVGGRLSLTLCAQTS